MKRTRVALVGAGYIAGVHAGFLKQLQSTVEMVAIADLDSSRRDATAKTFGIPATYADLEDMLMQARPDVVHVLTPPHTHAAVAATALRSGCHVLVEKPMAMSVVECEEMLAASRESGKTIGVVHNELFDPPVVRLQQHLRSQAAGTPFHMDILRGTAFPQAGGVVPWAYQAPANLLYDIGPHPLYLIRSIFGPIRRVSGSVRESQQQGRAVRDDWRVHLECERGTASMGVTAAVTPVQSYLTVFGSSGTIHVDLMRMFVVRRQPSSLPSAVARGLSSVREGLGMAVQTSMGSLDWLIGRLRAYEGLGRLIEQYHTAVASGAPPPVSGAEGLDVVGAIESIVASATVVR